MKDSSVVLLSAGLDSTVNFYAALQETEVKLAITFDYGQRAAKKEIEKSAHLANANHVPHRVIEVSWLKDLGQSSLTHTDFKIPVGSSVEIDNKAVSDATAKSVWVPNRNGIFLNIAGAFAESLNAGMIVPGFNAEEAVTFPDNSFDFLRATRKALSFSTANKVDVQCFTINMTKIDIVKLGEKLKVPFHLIWPCYFDREKWCGLCESCQRSKRAFKVAKILDIYQNFEYNEID